LVDGAIFDKIQATSKKWTKVGTDYTH
jgi:hypothetical protein